MMKYLLISAIVLICGANVCQSAKVAIDVKSINSTEAVITFDFIYDKDHNEKFAGLNITKDSEIFYSYNNITYTPVFSPVYGVNSLNSKINDDKKAQIVIANLSSETSGTYGITFYYIDAGKPKSVTNTTKLNVADKEINATKTENVTMTFDSNKVTKGKDMKLNCTFVLDGKDTFRNLRLSKDKTVFYTTDFNLTKPVKGVSGTVTYDKTGRKVDLNLKNVSDDTIGKYRCEVEYYNGSATNYHVFSEITLNAGYQHLLSYLLAIVCFAVFAINH